MITSKKITRFMHKLQEERNTNGILSPEIWEKLDESLEVLTDVKIAFRNIEDANRQKRRADDDKKIKLPKHDGHVGTVKIPVTEK